MQVLPVQGQTNAIQIPSLRELFDSIKVVGDDWVRFEDENRTEIVLSRLRIMAA